MRLRQAPVSQRAISRTPQGDNGQSARRSEENEILELQRTAGNRAVTSLLVQRDPTRKQKGRPRGTKSGKSEDKEPADTSVSVEKALEAFAGADEKSVQAAANAYIKGVAEAKDVEVGGGVKASGRASAAAQAAVWARGEVVELVNAYVVLAEAGLVVGGSLVLTGELKRKFGPVETKLEGSLKAFAGVSAEAKGRIKVGPTGVKAEGSVRAFAGAKSEQSASLSFDLDKLAGLEAKAMAEEEAGARFDADGTFSIAANEVAMSGKFSAFAGAKAKGKAEASGTLFGRQAFKFGVSGSASAGVGAEGHGGFRIRGGKLELEFHGEAAMAFGGGAGALMHLDAKPIGVWIVRKAYKAYWEANSKEASDVMANPDAVAPALTDELMEYADYKIKALTAGTADSFMKEEKVQAIVGVHVPYAQVKNHENAAAIDQMIKSSVENALRSATSVTKITATVRNGKVTKLEGLPDAKEIKKRSQVLSKRTGAALSGVLEYR